MSLHPALMASASLPYAVIPLSATEQAGRQRCHCRNQQQPVIRSKMGHLRLGDCLSQPEIQWIWSQSLCSHWRVLHQLQASAAICAAICLPHPPSLTGMFSRSVNVAVVLPLPASTRQKLGLGFHPKLKHSVVCTPVTLSLALANFRKILCKISRLQFSDNPKINTYTMNKCHQVEWCLLPGSTLHKIIALCVFQPLVLQTLPHS